MNARPLCLSSLAILAQSIHSEDLGLVTVTQEFSVEMWNTMYVSGDLRSCSYFCHSRLV